jgi:hypothetical protein
MNLGNKYCGAPRKPLRPQPILLPYSREPNRRLNPRPRIYDAEFNLYGPQLAYTAPHEG